LPRLEPFDAGPDRVHGSRHVASRDDGKRERVSGHALAYPKVQVIESDGANADPHFPGPRLRQRPLFEAENLGAAVGADDEGSHEFSP
jgi:hypothetical protein